jgi:hypothetical protein
LEEAGAFNSTWRDHPSPFTAQRYCMNLAVNPPVLPMRPPATAFFREHPLLRR